jgi:Mg-chelatase subunit ChlI
LAEQASRLQTMHYADRSDAMLDAYEEAGRAYRAAIAPKRTRAEVDAEIVTVVRMAFGAGSVEVRSGAVNMTGRMEDLCREVTAPEPVREPTREELNEHSVRVAGARKKRGPREPRADEQRPTLGEWRVGWEMARWCRRLICLSLLGVVVP